MTGHEPELAPSWSRLEVESRQRLRDAGVESATREAQWIIEEVGGCSASDLRRGARSHPTDEQVETLTSMVDRRVAGEPLQYVLGHWPFRSLDLKVDRRVLIPRPETEQVAEVALAALDRTPRGSLAVDLGTGTGALALSLAVERPDVTVWAIDVDRAALDVAAENLRARTDVTGRVHLVRGCWFDPLPDALRGTVDLVVSNPPYVELRAPLPPSVVEWEPHGALFAGPDGLDAIRVIVGSALEWLAPDGALVIEIGAEQGPAASTLVRDAGYVDVEIRPDLAGLDRIVIGRKPRG